MPFIHQHPQWPHFYWDDQQLIPLLTGVHQRHGRLMGRMESLGFDLRAEACLQALTEDLLKSNEIEGQWLDPHQVRSSLARRLGLDVGGLATSAEQLVEGLVEMVLDATQNYATPLTAPRLFSWHAALFPSGHKGLIKIQVAQWRDDRYGPMQVVSGPLGKERVHFEAPGAHRLEHEMQKFLDWFQKPQPVDGTLKAAIAHLWFITIHPFDDGNGRIARALADMALAQWAHSPQRFYSMSSQICKERKAYYEILETTQKGTLDITDWLVWFLQCLGRALNDADTILSSVLAKARFWETHGTKPLNQRQRHIINRLLNGFEGKLTSSKWAKLGKCSQDTALRDIEDLLQHKILIKNPERGRSTHYTLIK